MCNLCNAIDALTPKGTEEDTREPRSFVELTEEFPGILFGGSIDNYEETISLLSAFDFLLKYAKDEGEEPAPIIREIHGKLFNAFLKAENYPGEWNAARIAYKDGQAEQAGSDLERAITELAKTFGIKLEVIRG